MHASECASRFMPTNTSDLRLRRADECRLHTRNIRLFNGPNFGSLSIQLKFVYSIRRKSLRFISVERQISFRFVLKYLRLCFKDLRVKYPCVPIRSVV